MRNSISKKTIIIVFIIMLSATTFYYSYKKNKINRPIAAKLVYTDTDVSSSIL